MFFTFQNFDHRMRPFKTDDSVFFPFDWIRFLLGSGAKHLQSRRVSSAPPETLKNSNNEKKSNFL